jgi:hypothetical protein
MMKILCFWPAALQRHHDLAEMLVGFHAVNALPMSSLDLAEMNFERMEPAATGRRHRFGRDE